MKVHPMPKKRIIALRSDVSGLVCRQKKLRRLPHIFSRVLELPFHSDADVSIDETPEFLRFSAETEDIGSNVRADTVQIYPGVMKIVIRGENLSDLEEFELDVWRFRLPNGTRTELAYAEYRDGELVVTVPKGEWMHGDDERGNWAERGSLVVVQ